MLDTAIEHFEVDIVSRLHEYFINKWYFKNGIVFVDSSKMR